MSFLRGPSIATGVVTPSYTGLQVQTSSNALPIPVVYGRTRIAPNIIWSGDFQTIPQYSTSRTGKGGLFSSSSTQVTSYSYQTALLLGLCEGPIDGLISAYDGQSVSAPTDVIDGSFTGTSPQRPWPYLSARHPQRALGYGGTALAYAAHFDLGSNASIGSLAFEVAGRLAGSSPVNRVDADPAAIVYDFLTSAQYGIGFPPGSIDATSLFSTGSDGSYQTYCLANRLALSPALTDQEAANTILSRWLELTNATAVWSGGRLRFVPLGDTKTTATLGGKTVTYQPAGSILYDLTDEDFIADPAADPVIVTRSDPYTAPNVVVLEALDRANQYSATSIEARDQAAIEQYGLRAASTTTAHDICDLGIAATAAQLMLQRQLYVRNTYAFKLSWIYCLLEPMDVVSLTDAGLGLARTPVRIMEIAEGDDGLLNVVAEEYPGQIGAAIGVAPDSAANDPVNRSVIPSPVNTPFILEPPADLTGGTPQIWLGLSGGASGLADPNWGGAAIFASLDNATYTQVGIASGAAKQGVLLGAMPRAPATLADVVQIDVAESAAVIVASGDEMLVAVDTEIVAFRTATLTAASRYALGALTRQRYGGHLSAHAPGAAVLVLDRGVFTYNLPPTYIGRRLWFKFASFNSFGRALQDLSTCVAYPYVPFGSGLVGPVAANLATGTPLDEGLSSSAVSESDDFGLVSDPYTSNLDLGLASEGVTVSPLAGASPSSARATIGAAASGANTDITSLASLSSLTIGKAGAIDTAATFFKSGGTLRAIAGLIGSDRYRVSASPDGSTFNQGVDIDSATGHVGLAGYTADANNALGVLGTNFLFAASADSCRFMFNKQGSTFDASLTFETNYSARALLGLLGSDSYQLKVSPDGSTYRQVYVVDQGTANIAFKALVGLASYTVAALPAATNGCLAFATNGRKIGEATGAGTGVVTVFSNGQWRRLADDNVVSA